MPNILDTLAAAYAESGSFDKAIEWENKALSFQSFARSAGDQGRRRLKLYTDRKPYHQPQPK
jgi:hypothetical protein